MRRHRIPKERMRDTTPLTAAEIMKAYLVRHPQHVSDVAYIIEIKKERQGVVMSISKTPSA